MNNSIGYYHNLKCRIIINVLDYIEHNKQEDRKEALEKLSEFSKFYNVPLRRKALIPELKLHLRQFILNHDGYNNTIVNLYNSLQN